LRYSQVLKLLGDACGHASLMMLVRADLTAEIERTINQSNLTNKAAITCQ